MIAVIGGCSRNAWHERRWGNVLAHSGIRPHQPYRHLRVHGIERARSVQCDDCNAFRVNIHGHSRIGLACGGSHGAVQQSNARVGVAATLERNQKQKKKDVSSTTRNRPRVAVSQAPSPTTMLFHTTSRWTCGKSRVYRDAALVRFRCRLVVAAVRFDPFGLRPNRWRKQKGKLLAPPNRQR